MNATAEKLASPLSWVGGKYYAARRIVAAFPSPSSYDTYVEPFGGAAHVLVARPPGRHLEVYNDLNGDLVNFWLMTRDHAAELQARIDSLPYSRAVFYAYRASLADGTPLDDLERAARWFYCMRSTFSGHPSLKKGWGYQIGHSNNGASALRSATALLSLVAERFRLVQIEQQDYAKIIQVYQTPRTLFYCDPPYIGCEHAYEAAGMPLFSEDDHRHLAALLNATPALVALSYYDHPWLADLYPPARWRRLTWTQPKAVEKTRGQRQQGQEVLLMNYPPAPGDLWTDLEAEQAAGA
jgi:DNA adenine methylase